VIKKKAFEDGLKKLKDHKFKEGTGISYEEQLEIEKELFGDVGVLSNYQFNAMNEEALNVKYPEEETGQTEQEDNSLKDMKFTSSLDTTRYANPA